MQMRDQSVGTKGSDFKIEPTNVGRNRDETKISGFDEFTRSLLYLAVEIKRNCII